MLDVWPGDGRNAVQEVAAGEVRIIAVVHDRRGPVDGEGLAVDLETREEEVVFGFVAAENGASAGDRDNVKAERGIAEELDPGTSEGVAVDFVANLRGKLEEG